MNRFLLCLVFLCLFLTGCGPMDPGARWQVYEGIPRSSRNPRVQVLTYVVNGRRATYQLRLVFPDGSRVHMSCAQTSAYPGSAEVVRPDGSRQGYWELEIFQKDPTSWKMYEYDPDNRPVAIPMRLVAEGHSLGGAGWDTVDRDTAESQPAGPV
jgi:hypothetical protein